LVLLHFPPKCNLTHCPNFGIHYKNNDDFRPEYVDNIKIYKFIKEIYSYQSNNVVTDFENVSDIIEYLREQWSGLFQRFLQEESKREDYKTSQNLKDTANTLSKIIEYTTRERDETIKSILIHSHPVFNQIAQATGIKIRIFFSDLDELNTLLKTFGFEEFPFPEDNYYQYDRICSDSKTTLEISKDIFDDANKLKAVEQGEWDRSFVKHNVEKIKLEDDVPF
jgi:hypothetical protein